MNPIKTTSSAETIQIAKNFARTLRPGSVLLLEGNLGSGKTTFVKGVVEGVGAAKAPEVTSPTFVIMHHYKGRRPVYHFDLYRLESEAELEAIGFDEFVNDSSAITCIEWPENAGGLIPEGALRIRLEVTGENERTLYLPKETLHE